MSYDTNNVFAKILRGELPAHKVYETESVLAFMDIMPRIDGHTLVIPKMPACDLLDIEPAQLGDLIKAVQTVARGVKTAMKADGLTIQQFNGAAAGQIVFHIHFHILPRRSGISLRPHTGEMEKPEVLARHALAIREALAS